MVKSIVAMRPRWAPGSIPGRRILFISTFYEGGCSHKTLIFSFSLFFFFPFFSCFFHFLGCLSNPNLIRPGERVILQNYMSVGEAHLPHHSWLDPRKEGITVQVRSHSEEPNGSASNSSLLAKTVYSTTLWHRDILSRQRCLLFCSMLYAPSQSVWQNEPNGPYPAPRKKEEPQSTSANTNELEENEPVGYPGHPRQLGLNARTTR